LAQKLLDKRARLTPCFVAKFQVSADEVEGVVVKMMGDALQDEL